MVNEARHVVALDVGRAGAAKRDEALGGSACPLGQDLDILSRLSLQQSLVAQLSRRLDQLGGVGRRHAREHDEPRIATYHLGHDREKIRGSRLVRVRAGNDGKPQRLGRRYAFIALLEGFSRIQDDEADRFEPLVLLQIFENDRSQLITRDDAQDRVLMGR